MKVTVKRSDLNDLQRKVRSGEVSRIMFQDKAYILDTVKTENTFEIRLYPEYFSSKGRNDGWCLSVGLDNTDWERTMLTHYTEMLQQLPGSFDNTQIEIEEDIPEPPKTKRETILNKFRKWS